MVDTDKIISFFSSRTCQGVYNNSNTCYISSSLACLAHCMHFAYPIIANMTENEPITGALQDIYKNIWIKQVPVHPSTLLNLLQPKLDSIISLHEQNDVMEFVTLFIDILNQEIGKPITPKVQNQQYKGHKKLNDFMICGWVNSHKLAYSYLCDVFYGQNLNQTKCDLCGFIEHNSEIFCNISLSLDLEDNNDITSMINAYFKQESVKRNCDGCKLHNVSASKIARIWRTPQILIIHIKRFTANNMKLRSKVAVPSTIDLDSYTLMPSVATKFELKGISCHGGVTTGGHYFSVVKNPSDQWYIMDDSDKPKPIKSYQEVNSQYFYTLFYEVV